MRRLLSLLVLAGCGSSASACINGWQSPAEEQEFRSQYRAAPSAPLPTDDGYRPGNGMLIALGTIGLIGAGTLALRTTRTRV